MISGLFDFRASACTNSPPMPSAAAPASMNSAAVFRLTPPVGTSGICGSGPFRALMYFAPPTWPHGKILTKSAPASQAVMTSVGVNAPAMITFPSRTASSTVFRFNPGLTRNCAPASRHRRAASALSTVPAPTRTSEALFFASSRMTSRAPGTVMVISTMGMPPRRTASAAIRASPGDDARTTGTIPISMIRSRTFCLSIGGHLSSGTSSSARDARSDSFHHLQDFLQGCHRGVSRRGHGERTVRGATFHRPLRILSPQESVNQAGSKGIASSDTVENLKIFTVFCLIEFAAAIADCTPIILSGRFGLPESGRNDLEGIILHDLRDHLLETLNFEHGVMLVHPRHVVTKRRREVFLIAKHDVYVRCDAAVDVLCLFFAAVRLPQGRPVVQVVRNDRAVPPRCLHGFQGDFRARLRKSAEDATAMKPARALLSKNLIPIDVARLQLGDRGVPAIVTSQRCTHPEAALRKI